MWLGLRLQCGGTSPAAQRAAATKAEAQQLSHLSGLDDSLIREANSMVPGESNFFNTALNATREE